MTIAVPSVVVCTGRYCTFKDFLAFKTVCPACWSPLRLLVPVEQLATTVEREIWTRRAEVAS